MTLIPKPEKDSVRKKKLLSSILGEHSFKNPQQNISKIWQYIKRIIQHDQMGFIPRMQAWSNTYILINVLNRNMGQVYKESWVLKNWCFWTVVLEKTRESPLDCKKIQPVHPKGNQPWIFIGRTDAEAEAPTLATWCKELTHWKKPWCWKRLKAGEGDDRGWDGWMASLTRWIWVWESSGESLMDREAWHAAVHGFAESDTTERLNWTEQGCVGIAVPWLFFYHLVGQRNQFSNGVRVMLCFWVTHSLEGCSLFGAGVVTGQSWADLWSGVSWPPACVAPFASTFFPHLRCLSPTIPVQVLPAVWELQPSCYCSLCCKVV